MARTKLKQYVDTITVDQDDLDDLAEAMSDVLKYGVIQMDDNKLANMASLTVNAHQNVDHFAHHKVTHLTV